MSSLLAALLFTADIILVSLIQQQDMYLDILANGCAIVAWLVHFSTIVVLQKTVYRRARGPPLLLLLVLLSVPNTIITIISYDSKEYLNVTEPLKISRFALASARAVPILVYLLAFAFPCVSDAGYTLYVNAVDGSPLISEISQPQTGEMVAEDGAGCFSRLFYLWLTPLLKRGQRGALDKATDVYHLPWKLQTSVIRQYFHRCWDSCHRGDSVTDGENQCPTAVSRNLQSGSWSSHHQEESSQLEGDASLSKVLHKTFGFRYYILGLQKVLVNMLSFAGPLLLSSLVNFVEEKGAPVSTGVWCTLGLFVTTLLSSVFRNIFVFEISKVALSARAALVSAIYGKALQVSSSNLARFTMGEVINLMSTDVDRVVNFFTSFHELWSMPFCFIATLYLMYLQVGVAFLGGLCVAVLLVPFNRFLASRILSNNKQMLNFCYMFVFQIMTEILFGIRVIKFYTWESHFTQKVSDCRKEELSHLKAIKYLDALCVYTWAALPVVISIITFITYVLLGNQLTAAKVGVSTFTGEFLQIFLITCALHFTLLIRFMSVCPCQGSLVVVVGKVGCGKSSLLAALTGELNREVGFGLAAQEPWIQHASVRDNILFGKHYDPLFYHAVIEACSLADDLKVLPNGDRTEVGENGVTLSGGQKARLALARAVYMNKDIYLLDDPLAAVDTDVAEHLMKKCIMELLRGKTRILCTHRIEFVKKADMVVLMDNGTIIRTGRSKYLDQEFGNILVVESLSPLSSSVQTLMSSNNMSSDTVFYLTVYSSIAAANTVFTAIRAFLFAYGTICAAKIIHNRLLDRVLQATVTFFDTTPMGRILNRFSSDLYSVDDSLPFILNILLATVFNLLGMLVVMSYGLPWVLLALPPLAIFYYRTQDFYRQTSRELKRLCSLTLSPIYSHFSETLSGLGTIRASGSCARFEEENIRRLELNQRCQFLSKAAMQWLDIRLQLIGVAVVSSLSTIAVIQHQYSSVDPGLVGLSLSYSLSITTLLSGLIFSFTQTEMQLVSVERTEEYSTDLPIEPQNQNKQLDPVWPAQGWLEFRSVVLAYRDGLPNALDGVSFVVRPGEKVGIVGRTGSGKSTLFLALFRMLELNQGQIFLDGLDICTVGLAQLRSRLAIIPQDPFLFSGTIRENLDPCGRHSDPQLLDVLMQCHLSDVVYRMGGLDAEVGERGRCFSVGQRQLLCLARALMTHAKLLCIDEATASVDQKTDKLLQQTIREKFQNKTVLTIAHRINTIMDCERVLVLHAGKVVEFDTPAALCQMDRSIFQRLVGHRAE
uniref:ATP-binding cassette, sub-family C (CFTR/MRP), member 10 n=1 Tax=Takifugu rubripes TaxID=31033 RepID=A0A674PL73_TAKRU